MAFTLERLRELERLCLVGQHIAHTDQLALVRQLLAPLLEQHRAGIVADALMDRRVLLMFPLPPGAAEITLRVVGKQTSTHGTAASHTSYHVGVLEPDGVIELAVVGR